MNRPPSNEFSRYYEPIQKGQVRGMRPKRGIKIKRRKKTGTKARRKKVPTFTTSRERSFSRRPSLSQTATDFMTIHQSALLNKARETETEKRLELENKKLLAIEDRKQTAQALALRETEIADRREEVRLKELQDERRHLLELDNNRRQEKIAMEGIAYQRNQQRLMEDFLRDYASRLGQQERRTGELNDTIQRGIRDFHGRTQQSIPIEILRRSTPSSTPSSIPTPIPEDTDIQDISPPPAFKPQKISPAEEMRRAREAEAQRLAPQLTEQEKQETIEKIYQAMSKGMRERREQELPRQTSAKELEEKDVSPYGLKPPDFTSGAKQITKPKNVKQFEEIRDMITKDEELLEQLSNNALKRQSSLPARPPVPKRDHSPIRQRSEPVRKPPPIGQNVINERERLRRQQQKPTEDPAVEQRREERIRRRPRTTSLSSQTLTIREPEPDEQRVGQVPNRAVQKLRETQSRDIGYRQESDEYTPRTLQRMREEEAGSGVGWYPTKPPPKAVKSTPTPTAKATRRVIDATAVRAGADEAIEIEDAWIPQVRGGEGGSPAMDRRIYSPRTRGEGGEGQPSPPQQGKPSGRRKQTQIQNFVGLREPEPEPEPLRPDLEQQQRLQSRLEEFDRIIGTNKNKSNKRPNQKVSVKLEILKDLDRRELGGRGNIPIKKGSYPMRNYGAGQAPSDNARKFLFYKDFYNDVKVARKVNKVEGGEIRQVPKIEGKDFALDLYGKEDFFRKAIVDGKIKFSYIDPQSDESYTGEIIH